jgi:hypothetical protein
MKKNINWIPFIEQWKASGLSQNRFCKANGISSSSFNAAVRRITQEGNSSNHPNKRNPQEAINFAEVSTSNFEVGTIKPKEVNPTLVLKNASGIVLEVYL